MRHTINDLRADDGTTVSGSGIIVAAKVNPGIDWAAYYDRIEGNDLGYDWLGGTARYGNKLPEAVARFFFPGIEEPYRG